MRCTAVASTERDCHFCVCCVSPFREDQSIEMTYRAYIKNTVCSLVMQTDLLSAQYNDSPTSSHCGCYSSCQRVSDRPAPLASAWLIRNEGKLPSSVCCVTVHLCADWYRLTRITAVLLSSRDLRLAPLLDETELGQRNWTSTKKLVG